jgi:hypothetical protein
MQTMDAALVDLVRRNKITREFAMKRSSTPEELIRLLGQTGMPGAPGGNGMPAMANGGGMGATR